MLISAPSDAQARERALALESSFIVRAPAGSGKTDLLTRRFLKLLAAADEPEEVLAITFTRAATAEMRARVLEYLEQAMRWEPEPNEDERVSLARAALERSDERGWRLLEQPHRLNIETIDSLCMRIAHSQPLLSRMGGRLSPLEHAEPLYAEAARRTLGLLGTADAELDAALSHLLELRDNHLPDCESLIAEMLAQRDQWVRAFPLTAAMGEEEWSDLRTRLEAPFAGEARQIHAEVHRLIVTKPGLASDLVEMARYACGNGNGKIAALSGMRELPVSGAASVSHWRCIADFLLKGDHWRRPRGLNVREGFPPDGKEQKTQMGDVLERLTEIDGLREALCAARDLPEPQYDADQWQTLRHIFVTLRRAVAELRVLFAERDAVDFTEVSLAAREVLSSADAGPDVLLAMSGNIRHLLVDEFQDTSRSQHELLRLLIRAWEASEGRTCFLVGDPMQSVYLFRQAEVELFEHVARNGLVSEEHTVPLEEIELLTNFRSHEGLTSRWNEMFSAVFSGAEEKAGQITYSHTVASEPALPGETLQVYPQILGDVSANVAPGKKRALEAEAEQVLAIIAEHQERIDRAVAEKTEYRVAVLARSRLHLARIVALLRERGVAFRAVELDSLNERQELMDLFSLVRALLHPMDRIAWLSVLRAPWSGLTLKDLHALSGADDPAFRYKSVFELIETRGANLSDDGAGRLRRTAAILKQALEVRFEGLHSASFAQWIERTWRTLGGRECVDAAAYENVQTFFALLDAVTPDGVRCLTTDFEEEMKRLFAQPDPRASEKAGVQLMTIHKAKGLGFDVVIVPGLDRHTAPDKSPLICSLERMNPATGETEMLVAPIGLRGGDKHPTYKWVLRQRSLRADEELKRLLYVACTRARTSLHLLGTATLTKSGLKAGDRRSLLHTAWPALKRDFEEAQQARQVGNVVPFPARPDEGVGLELAATADAPRRLLRRLRVNTGPRVTGEGASIAAGNVDGEEPVLERPQGSRDARRKGSVVHALLEQLSRGVSVEALAVMARNLLRAAAYSGKALEDATAEAMNAVKNCAGDPDGGWILEPHPQAQSEVSWTGWKDGALETVRADRVFIGGDAPRAPGETHLWIVDYKMSASAGDMDFLAQQRKIYAPQLVRYARAIREAQGIELPVRLGLYFPRIPRLDWWAEES